MRSRAGVAAAALAATWAAVTPSRAQVEERSVVLTAAGDLVPNALAMASIRRAPTEAEGYATFLGGYAEALAAAPPNAIDYVNLEVPLVDDVVPLDGGWPASLPEHPRRAPVLGATAALAPVLAHLGVDVVGLANNHAYDQRCAGLRRTRDAVTSSGIGAVGASEHAADALGPLVIERGGARVAFVSFSTSFNRSAHDEPRMVAGHDEPEAVAAALASARAQADLVVVLVHWGRDFQPEPGSDARALARRLVDEGADVIFGTGPHVLHRVARLPSPRGEALVAYSLGNVASGMGRAYRLGHPPHTYVHPANALPEGRDGALLVVRARRDAGGRVSIGEVRATPLWMENDFVDHPREATIRAVRLSRAAREVCQERLPVVREALGPEVAIDEPCAP